MEKRNAKNLLHGTVIKSSDGKVGIVVSPGYSLSGKRIVGYNVLYAGETLARFVTNQDILKHELGA